MRCPRCKRDLPKSAFGKNRSTKTGLTVYCRPCHQAKVLESRARHPDAYRSQSKRYREANADRLRKKRLAYSKTDAYRESRVKSYAKHRSRILERKRERRLSRYGLTIAEFDELRDRGCAICGEKRTGKWGTLHMDHDHKTGAFRALLCVGCNRAIGFIGDDATKARAIVRYLERHGGKLA